MIIEKTNVKYKLGDIYYVCFGKTISSEINNIHLAIIFPIKSCKNMIFCLPLTSPKEKHFKTKNAYLKREYHSLTYCQTYYVKSSDSIALFDQFRVISVNRLKMPFKNQETNEIVKLSNTEIKNIIKAFNDFLKSNIFTL